jgi:hypothetical protein
MKLMLVLLTLSTLLCVDTVSAQSEPSRLLGSWQLSLSVTGQAPQSAGPRAASGKLDLQRLTSSGSPSGSIVYSVSYDTTLHAMFGPQRFGPAQAVLTAAGAIELVFNPFVDHGAFRLRGMERGDSIVGEWHRTAYADDGYRGVFRMVRRH